jgi:hypothetical protein
MNPKAFSLNGATPSTGALDFSWLLDAPAGKHGFLRAQGDQLVFEDGTPIRFFGTNLTRGGGLPEKEAAVLVADRLAKAGANLLRLHYIEGKEDNPRTTLIDYERGDSQHFNADSLDRLDYLIHLLKERGIYVHIDLLVARNFLPGDDLEYPDDLATGAWIKKINIFNRRLIDLQKKYATRYLTHLNPYTGLRYVDDPAVAAVQVMNENSIIWCRCANTPSYEAELDRRWNAWLLEKYGNRESLDQAWTDDAGTHCLTAAEDPAKGSVARPAHGLTNKWDDPYQGAGSPVRRAEHTEFLIGLQLAFSQEMREHLLELGVKCLINISNHALGPADMRGINPCEDVVENNAYWNHPSGALAPPCKIGQSEMYAADPRRPTDQQPPLVTRLSFSRAQDKPHLVTEWNEVFATDLSSEGMLMMTAYGALQGWNGMLLYSYNRDTTVDSLNDDTINGFFNVKNDPSTWGQFGICSAIFQLGWVKAAEKVVDLCYTPEDSLALPETWKQPFGFLPYVSRVGVRMLDNAYQGHADVALASGNTPTGDYSGARRAIVYSRSPYAEMSRQKAVREEYLARHAGQENVHVIENAQEIDDDLLALSRIVDERLKNWGIWQPDQGLIDERALVSDTGEIAYRFGDGTLSVKTPYVSGFAGNVTAPIDLGPVTLNLTNDKMTAILAPLDRQPLATSRHLLLSLVGRSANTNMTWDGDRLLDMGKAPVWIDQACGTIELPSDIAEVYPLRPDGQQAERLTVTSKQAAIGDGAGTINYEIRLFMNNSLGKNPTR